MAFFSSVQQAPPDAIFGIKDKYSKDTDPRKINLSVGAYRTDDGLPYVLPVVKKAEQQILDDASCHKEYLPMSGHVEFRRLAARTIFGEHSKALLDGRVTTVQSLSGTGSLRLAFTFMSWWFAPRSSVVYVSDPTWGNQVQVANHAGLHEVRKYRYYDEGTRGLDFDGMCADLRAAPERSIIVLHTCAHNPTGVDPTKEQWETIISIVKDRNLFPLFDTAYQGFATGDLDRDALSIRMATEQGLELMVCQSFAKNMGLYGERIGALHLVCQSSDVAGKCLSQLQKVARGMYSNPPKHGAEIASRILGSEELYKEWQGELKIMSGRILKMRQALYDKLLELGTPGTWDHIINQIGMFTYTGLTREQSLRMMDAKHVYLLPTGRISLAGLNSSNVEYIAKAIHEVVTTEE